jgi:hypothetical protein
MLGESIGRLTGSMAIPGCRRQIKMSPLCQLEMTLIALTTRKATNSTAAEMGRPHCIPDESSTASPP